MAFSDNPLFPSQEEAAEYGFSDTLDIEEWQTYYARFYSGCIPDVVEQSSFVIRKASGFIELNFRNFVGLSRIGQLSLHVLNRKICGKVYRAMLDELADNYANLVFSFATPVGQHYEKKKPGRDSEFVEYLFLSRYLLRQSPDIEALGNLIIHEPHRQFLTETQTCPIEQCRELSGEVVQSLLGGPMIQLKENHSLAQTGFARILEKKTGKNLFPVNGIHKEKRFTLDTNENRFLKFFFEWLLARIEKLKRVLIGNQGGFFNPEISKELDTLHKNISLILAHTMWREVGPMQFIPANSQILQRKEGYSNLFKLYSLLQLYTQCNFVETDFENLIEIKDLPTLYEYWCFFRIKGIMDLFSSPRRVTKIINHSSLEHTITAGLKIEYDNGTSLFFNKTYSGSSGEHLLDFDPQAYRLGQSYSHGFRPDITIELGSAKLIFDAKYKGRKSGFYGGEEQGVIDAWKEEDIDKMHCYHDAIEDVVGSFILYPGIRNVYYPHHAGTAICEAVGAISLQPGSGNDSINGTYDLLVKLIKSFLETANSRKESKNG